MKKVGIITFHYAYNFGSKLQAYALQTYLNQIGYGAKIINYIYDFDMYQYRLFHWTSYRERPKRLFRDILTLSKKIQRKKKFDDFDRKYLDLTKEYHDCDSIKELNSHFDAYIAGSDQIWNTDCTCAVVPAYFLDFAKDTHIFKMAYAPSIAHDKIDKKYIAEFQNGIRNFNVLSVRENTGKTLCQKLTDKPVSQIDDPVFLLTAQQYKNISSPIRNVKKNNYIFVYTLEKNQELIEYAKRVSVQNNLTIVYFSEFKIRDFGKNSINIFNQGPLQFLWLVDNARFVITNSFHATAFSVIFLKQFVTFLTNKSGSRMKDFLGKFELENRIYREGININCQINTAAVNRRLLQEQNRCREFLCNSLMEWVGL